MARSTLAACGALPMRPVTKTLCRVESSCSTWPRSRCRWQLRLRGCSENVSSRKGIPGAACGIDERKGILRLRCPPLFADGNFAQDDNFAGIEEKAKS